MASPSPQEILDVARYLSAAYVAYAHGSGMDYTRKKYADNAVGRFWLDVAELDRYSDAHRGGRIRTV